MRYNGIQLIIRMAVSKVADPRLERYRDALILGAIREDVVYLPWAGGKIWEHWSLSHFWGTWAGGGFFPWIYPSAPYKAQRFYDRAVRLAKAGDPARAMVQLGRASHLLIDMACPAHASRVPHLSDGYEWYVDGNYETLKALPFTIGATAANARELVAGMARVTQRFAPDRTNHPWGRLLKKAGLRKSLARREFAEQAAALIPEAASRLGAMYANFLTETAPC